MRDRVCIVTGAGQGIGFETARVLAALGATVVMVCPARSDLEAAHAELAAAKIREEATTDAIALIFANHESQASIRAAAAAVRDRFQQVHVLVNNAGGIFERRRLTAEGIERTFAINHLSHYLLTLLLLGRLQASGSGRVVTVSSVLHHLGTIDFDDLHGNRRYGGLRAYCQAKLANVLFTSELARRLAGKTVTANCLHPGVVRSGFARNNSGWLGWSARLAAPLMITPSAGARTSVYLASSAEVTDVTGSYFVRCAPRRPSRASRNRETAARLWGVSARLCGVGGDAGEAVRPTRAGRNEALRGAETAP